MSQGQGRVVALTTVYAQPAASWRSAPHGCRKLPGSWWYWVLLGAGWVSTAVLVGVVLWLLQREGGNSPIPSQGMGVSWGSYPSNSSRCDTPESRCSVDCFRLQLRERLCERGHHAAGTCWLCPAGWRPFRAKCYWASPKSQSWEVAAANCSEQGSRLAVLESEEEKHFIQEMIQRGSGAWIGLKQTGGKSWTWWDGSPLQQDWYPVQHSETGDACAVVGTAELRSHMCSTPLRWVCQREATGI